MLQPLKGSDENVDLSRFDLLNCPRVEIGQLGKPFLSDAPNGAFSTKIRAQTLQSTVVFECLGHALLGRAITFD